MQEILNSKFSTASSSASLSPLYISYIYLHLQCFLRSYIWHCLRSECGISHLHTIVIAMIIFAFGTLVHIAVTTAKNRIWRGVIPSWAVCGRGKPISLRNVASHQEEWFQRKVSIHSDHWVGSRSLQWSFRMVPAGIAARRVPHLIFSFSMFCDFQVFSFF